MKTVHACLKEVDAVKIADEYFSEYPIEYENFCRLKKTVAEIKEAYRLRFLEFLEMLRKLEVDSTAQDNIFFCHRVYSNYEKKVATVLCTKTDILACDKPETYSCILVDFAEVMGYCIADTELTKKNIYAVLAQLLHEMTFFGFTQEEINEEREQLVASLKEAAAGRARPAEEVFAELFEELGIEKDEINEQEKAMLADLREQEINYDMFQLAAECKKVKDLLAAQ